MSALDKSNPAASKQDTEPEAACDAADRNAGREAAGRQAEVAGGLQGGGLVERPSRRAHHGAGAEGHDLHGLAPASAASTRSPTRTASARCERLLQGLTQPNGLAIKDGALYVLAINKVLRFDNIEDKLDNPGEPVDLTDKFGLPPEVHHNWKYAAFGPDGKLYIQVGANCNICEINPGIHAQIRRYNPDGSGMEIVARGVRNTVGFDWHPVTKELWFTDNGRDWAGDAGPEDELNRVAKGQEGANYGFPYCHANGIPDPDIKKPNPCAGVVMPAALDSARILPALA